MSRKKPVKRGNGTRPRAAGPKPPPEPTREPDLGEALVGARAATLELVRGMESHREQSVALLRRFVDFERRLTLPEQDVAKLLVGIADTVDVIDRQLSGPAADPEADRERLRSTATRLEKLVAEIGRAELIGRIGETAEVETHEFLEVKDEPGAEEDTVLAVMQRGVRYQGELVRAATVITASGHTASREGETE